MLFSWPDDNAILFTKKEFHSLIYISDSYVPPHGGELQPDIENRIVDEDIAVQGPIVIVRGTAVVRLARPKGASDLRDEDRLKLPRRLVLPLLRGQLRIALLQFL